MTCGLWRGRVWRGPFRRNRATFVHSSWVSTWCRAYTVASCPCIPQQAAPTLTLTLTLALGRDHVVKGESRERRETASKTDETILSWPHERFFSSLVFATVAHSALISLAHKHVEHSLFDAPNLLSERAVEATSLFSAPGVGGCRRGESVRELRTRCAS